MDDRLTLRIATDGSLFLEGEAMTLQQLEQRLEEDEANNVRTTIIANSAEEPEWETIQPVLQLLMRFDRMIKGIVGTQE
ncbi:hypothetical protein [Qipengyuania sp. MTN3-11]|uniref:hypothetical protein n=1 Tax=Qipengyuania sp. MTN3-11 TaxID=3056557 RepID=UPI0036F1B7CB